MSPPAEPSTSSPATSQPLGPDLVEVERAGMRRIAALAGFLPAIWLAYAWDLGLGGVWAGLGLFTTVRLVMLLGRWRSARWAVLGAVR